MIKSQYNMAKWFFYTLGFVQISYIEVRLPSYIYLDEILHSTTLIMALLVWELSTNIVSCDIHSIQTKPTNLTKFDTYVFLWASKKCTTRRKSIIPKYTIWDKSENRSLWFVRYCCMLILYICDVYVIYVDILLFIFLFLSIEPLFI